MLHLVLECSEGKKITWRDGLKALFTIVYFWVKDDIYEELYGHAILYQLSQTHRFNTWMAETVKPWMGDSVLEIGAGLGNLTQKLTPRKSYTISDMDPLHLEYLRNRFRFFPSMEVRKVDLENPADFDPLEGRFDSIVCLNVLEHVEKEGQALENMYRSLRPGGSAIILVPQGQWLFGSHDTVLGHYRRYSRKALIDRCERAGFVMQRAFSFNRVGLFPWFLNGRILHRKNFGKLQLKIYDSFIWLWRLVDRFLPWPGLSIIGIAEKPNSENENRDRSNTQEI